jgi:anti-anti-sigma regulatory factor
VKTQKEKGVLIIELTSKDLADPVSLNEAFEQFVVYDEERRLVIDLSAVDYMTSLQIGAVVGLHIMAYENVAMLKFVGLSDKVKLLFRLLGIDTLVEMHYGRAQALESFGVE